MTEEFRDVDFDAKTLGGKWPQSLEELVQGWLAHWRNEPKKDEHFWATEAAFDLARNEPDWAWRFVLATLDELKPEQDDKVLAVLAAGPLEDLLANHGSEVIARVEDEARRSPRFRELLGGVWKSSMPEEVWQRVLKAAPQRW